MLAALLTDESPLREECVALAVDFVLKQPLRELFDFDEAATIVLGGLVEANVARVVERHVQPGFHRYVAQAKTMNAVVGELVPEPSREKIRAIVKNSSIPHAKWAEHLVDPALLRKLFGPVWVDLLLSFGARLPIPGAGAASGAAAAVGRGLAGRLTRSVTEGAGKLAEAGRSVMGGLGAEVERRIQAAARDFSEGATEIFRDALGKRLASPEGRELVEKITAQVLDRVMTTEIRAIQEDLRSLDVDGIFGVVPELVGTAVPHELITSVVRQEIAAFLAHEGDRSLSDLLGEQGTLDSVRKIAISRSSAVARRFFETPEFGAFLDRLLSA